MKIAFLQSILRPKEFTIINIVDYLDMVRAGKFEPQIAAYRTARENQEAKDIQTAIKNKIPAVTISGTFKEKVANLNLHEHSGFICIDFDAVENIEKFKEQLCNDKYTYSVLYSVSGEGLAAVVKIDTTKHIESYNGLKNYYFQKYSQLIDKACSNVSRFRFVSMDKDLYINPRSSIFKEYPKKEVQPKTHNVVLTQNEFGDLIGRIVERKLDLTNGEYANYLMIGFALSHEFGETGRSYFHIICEQNPKYEPNQCDKQYSYCLRDGGQKKIRIGTFYFLCKNAGVELKSVTGRKLEQIAKMAKKSGRTQQSVVDIARTIGLDEEAATEMAKAVFEKNVDLTVTAGSDVEVIATFLSSHYDLHYNIVTQEIEDHKIKIDGRYKIITESGLNTMYLKFIDETSERIGDNFFNKYVFSEYLPFYNPLLKFFEDHKDLPRHDDLITQLSLTIKSPTPNIEKWIRHWGCGIIASIYGTSSPLTLVLAGETLNRGKTEFFRRLLPPELKFYYAESNLDEGKDSDILMCKKIIIMDDEFSGKSKFEAKRFKKLTSKQVYSIRVPYGRTHVDMTRLAVLCGTTNDLSLLNDPTGNRRIIPINVMDIDKPLYNSIDKQALFMAFYDLYHSGFKWQFDTQDIADLNEYQDEFMAVNFESELIMAHFEVPEVDGGIGEWMTNTEIKTYIEIISRQKITSQARLALELIRLGFERKKISTYRYFVRKKTFAPDPAPQLFM